MDPFCVNCGEPFFGGLCVWCTCKQCGGNIHDGVCWYCNSNTYIQTSFNNPSDVPDYYPTPLPQSSLFNFYNCGNPSEEGIPCGQYFVINVDTPIVCAMSRVLTRLTLTI